MSAPSSPLVDFIDVSKRYGKVDALREITFTLDAGHTYGLLGPNGSGKTTCLHLLTGLLTPSKGSITLAGRPVADKETRALIGFAPDDLPLPASLTGLEYLRLHDALRRRDDSERAFAASVALAMDDKLDRQIAEYSHGMKRKIQLIAAIAHRPRLLILDEPFRGLDPEAAARLKELVTTFVAKGGTLLIATHDMLRAERDCETALILNKGRLVTQGKIDQLKEQYHVSTLDEVFLMATGSEEDRKFRQSALDESLS